MTWFELISVLVVLAALFSYLNHRYIKLPTTIGVMLIALGLSLALILVGSTPAGAPFRNQAARVVNAVDFDQALLHGMLALLLFAGALHLDTADLLRERVPVLVLSIFGTVLSTFIVAGLMYAGTRAVGLRMSMASCVLFGALISPTDPISVLGIMKRVGAPKRLESQLAGESLFNDGIGAVFFMVVLEALAGGHPTAGGVAWLLAKEALGGAAVGWAAGWCTNRLLRRVDNYQVEVLLTLALSMGGYALMDRLHVSAPIGIVVAGLIVGQWRTRLTAGTPVLSLKTREHLDTFWELIDEIMNAVLFLLIGLEVLVMPFISRYWAAAILAVGVTLIARWLSVGSLVGLMSFRRDFDRGATAVLTWGGLRGGISVALALSLPPREDRHLIVAITYGVVVFSLFVQGLSIGRVIGWSQRPARQRRSAAQINAGTRAA